MLMRVPLFLSFIVVVVETQQNVTFLVEPDPEYPHASVLISYKPQATNRKFRVDVKDLTPIDGEESPPQSMLLSPNPMKVSFLLPGHEYRIDIFDSKNDERVYRKKQLAYPRLSSQFPSVLKTDASSIHLEASLGLSSRQDYLLVWCTPVGDEQHRPPINITTPASQRNVSFDIKGLRPGAEYNLTVVAVKRDLRSLPYTTVVTIAPSNVRNVAVKQSEHHYLLVTWEEAENATTAQSSVDEYEVRWRLAEDATRGQVAGLKFETSERFDAEHSTMYNISGLTAGHKYEVLVYAFKNGQSSQHASRVFSFTKPPSPTSLSLSANFNQFHFELLVYGPPLPSPAVNSTTTHPPFDGCYIEYRRTGAASVNSSTWTQFAYPRLGKNFCVVPLSVIVGLEYRFTAMLFLNESAEMLNGSAITRDIQILPVFNATAYDVKLFTDLRTVRLTWGESAQSGAAVLAGYDSNLTCELRNDKEQYVGDDSVQFARGGTVSFHDLAVGMCHRLLAQLEFKDLASKDNATYYFRTDAVSLVATVRDIGMDTATVILNVAAPPSAANATVGGVIDVGRDCRVAIDVVDLQGRVVFTNSSIALPPAINTTTIVSSIPVTGLSPARIHYVSGRVVCSAVDSRCDGRNTTFRKDFRTAEGVPSPVRMITAIPVDDASVHVAWQSPEFPNGEITNYTLQFSPTDAPAFSGLKPWKSQVSGAEKDLLVRNRFTGGITYAISISASTSAGLGQPGSLPNNFEMPLAKPKVKKSHRPRIVHIPRSSGSDSSAHAKLAFNPQTAFQTEFSLADLFSQRQGVLKKYELIVEERSGADASHDRARNTIQGLRIEEFSSERNTWHTVHTYSDGLWPEYVALERQIVNGSANSNTVTVGGEHCGASDTVCNGPLRPGRYYRIYLRACVNDTLCSRSEPSDVVKTEISPASNQAAHIAIAILSICLVFALVLCIVVVVRRRYPRLRRYLSAGTVKKKMKKKRKRSRDYEDVADGSGRAAAAADDVTYRRLAGRMVPDQLFCRPHSFLPPLATVQPGTDYEKSRPVLSVDFGQHVRLMSADSDFRFSEEFEDLRTVGRQQPFSSAELPCNRAKNRFTNILPYDHSRVKLSVNSDDIDHEADGGDFINANYVAGFHSKREFIATQGPLASTRDDFWRMVWEQGAPVVVNLARCMEKGREKCDQYWPLDCIPVMYGDVELCLKNEITFPDFVMREYSIQKDNELRNLHHFHFTGWPDFGVPEQPAILLNFIRQVRQLAGGGAFVKPIIIHCSAGVGRSGTLIAVDHLMQLMMGTPAPWLIDVFGLVHNMRLERVWMVQTEQQYKYIHECTNHLIEESSGDKDTAELRGLYLMRQGTFPASPLHRPPPVPVHRTTLQQHCNPTFEDDEGIAESGL